MAKAKTILVKVAGKGTIEIDLTGDQPVVKHGDKLQAHFFGEESVHQGMYVTVVINTEP